MYSSLVFFAVVSGSFLLTDAQAVHKCDPKIVEKAKATWNGPNNDILDKVSFYLSWKNYGFTRVYTGVKSK